MKDTILLISICQTEGKREFQYAVFLQGLNNHIHQQAIKDFWLEDIYGQKP